MHSIDHLQYSDAFWPVALAELRQEAISGESIKLLPDSDQGKVSLGGVGPVWPSHYSSLQAPSLSASLNMSSQDTPAQGADSRDVANVSTASSQDRVRVSRRTAIVGIAGIAVLLGGVGIWRASSSEIKALPQNAQVIQKSSDAATSVVTSQRRTPGSTGNSSPPGTGGTNPAAGSGTATGKNGTTKPATTGKGGSQGTSTSSTPSSSSGNPPATSPPGNSSGETPVATGTATVVLTVQVNVPSSIAQNSNVPISVMTNSGNVSFTVTAEFYYVDKNGQTQNDRHANISGNTTDSSGNATINWQCWSIPYGQFKKMTDPRAVFQAIATDSNGKLVYSQNITAQVV